MRLRSVIVVTLVAASTMLLSMMTTGCPSTGLLVADVPDSGSPPPPLEDAATVSACGADLQSNANHCGRCDHSCLGGTCAKGLCQPAKVLSSVNTHDRFLRDGEFLYWVQDISHVVRCHVNGCDDRPIVVVMGEGPTGGSRTRFDIRDDAIFTIQAGKMRRTSKTNLTGKEINVAPAITGGNHLAVTSSRIIWTEATGGQWSVHSCGIQEDPCVNATVVTGDGSIQQLVAGDSGALWITIASDSSLRFMSWSYTAAPQQVVNATPPRVDLASAVMKDTAVWIEEGADASTSHSIKSAVLFPDMKPIAVVANDVGGARGVAYDESGVYFTSNNGTVQRVSISGGGAGAAPTAIADNQSGPTYIATDPVAVYWYNEGAKTIMKVAK